MPARSAFDGDRHDAGALDDLEHPSQPDFLTPGREVDADHRHRGVAVGATGSAHGLCGIPRALGTGAAAAADEIEHHSILGTHRRGFPTSLHVTYNACRPRHLAGESPSPLAGVKAAVRR